jgi:predicted nucleic acid-binding protein
MRTSTVGSTTRMDDARYGGLVLLDNSAWARVGLGRLRGADSDRFEQAVRADELVVCAPFALEALYSARSAGDFRRLSAELAGFRQASADHRTWGIAATAQSALAADPAVSHRVKPIDLLLAAVADQRALGVLHYDHDYDTIAAHTPLTFRSVWIAPRGSLE